MSAKFPILLIDDDPLLVDILRKASRQGFPEATFHQVSTATQALTYIDQLEGYALSLILLDLDLRQQENGFDLLTYLQSHPQANLVPVVILSVNDVAAQIKNAYDLGASSFTVKPFSYEGWVTYLSTLRQYWLETVSLPQVRFYKAG